MKILIGVAVLAVLGWVGTVVSAHADDFFGFEAGQNTSHFSLNPPITGVQGSSGLLAGMFADIDFDDESYGANYIEIEVRYIKKGFSSSDSDDSGGTFVGSSSAAFIEIPIVAKMKIQTGTFITPFLFAGPDVAIRISESDSLTDSNFPSLEYSGVNQGIFNTVGAAFDAGAGLEFDLASGFNIFAQFRYSAGFTNAINYSGSSADLGGVQFSGGMSLALDQSGPAQSPQPAQRPRQSGIRGSQP